jgi:hypothetical protein
LNETKGIFAIAIQSFHEADWEKLPLYRSWKEVFASGEAEEADVVRTYLGNKGIRPALGESRLVSPAYASSRPMRRYAPLAEWNGFMGSPSASDGILRLALAVRYVASLRWPRGMDCSARYRGRRPRAGGSGVRLS